MKNEQRQLLLKDLYGRLSHGVKFKADNEEYIREIHYIKDENVYIREYLNLSYWIDSIKPYLRPMSSMTEEEKKEHESFIFTQHHEWDGHSTYTDYVETDDVERYVTWLNKKGFDYRGLIPMGLALEAPKGMYKEK